MLAPSVQTTILEYMFGDDHTSDFPGTYYVALAGDNSDPEIAGSVPGDEISGGGYSRAELPNLSASWNPVGTDPVSISNAVVVEYDEATGAWDTATWFVLCDSPSDPMDTAMICYGRLLTPATLATGDIASFAPGTLEVGFDDPTATSP